MVLRPDLAGHLLQPEGDPHIYLVDDDGEGSWLNMAEIEIAILERNDLSRRLPDEAALRRHVLAVETERNQQRGISRQFTSRDARIKLERLYPMIEPSSD